MYIFPNSQVLIQKLTESLKSLTVKQDKDDQTISVVLSGGNTPRIWFDHLAVNSEEIDWSRVHLFWGDERCVPPEHYDSNYGMTKKHLLDKIDIPDQNVHRIRGEDEPMHEAVRYGQEILRFNRITNQEWPVFDWVLLGLGSDGHIASLFPNTATMQVVNRISTIAEHPLSGQRRITITLPVINHARRISFLVSGKSKAAIVDKIHGIEAASVNLPAAMVHPEHGTVEWFLDAAAASLLLKDK